MTPRLLIQTAVGQTVIRKSEMCVALLRTIDRCFPRQDHDDELQAGVGVLKVSEHGLHAVRSLRVLTETRLALDGHPGVLRDLAQLIREPPKRR